MEMNRMNYNIDINTDVNSKKNVSLKIQQTDNSINLNKSNENTANAKSQDNGYDERTDKLLNQVNDKFKIFNREFHYEIHEKTNRYIVTVKDSETGDTIKEIPSEKALDLFAKMLEMSGLLVDEKG